MVRVARPSRGFSLVEVAVAVAILGGLFAAALNVVGSASVARQQVADESRGAQLAEDLMAEIIAQRYEEPGQPAGTFGLETGESTGNRSLFDDVDDYDGWSESPVQSQGGTKIAGFAGWGRSVSVIWVASGDLTAKSGTDTRLKRVVVTVTKGARTLAKATAIRGAAMDSADVLINGVTVTTVSTATVSSFGTLP